MIFLRLDVLRTMFKRNVSIKTLIMKNLEKDVTHTFLTGKVSCTLIIKKELAQEYGLTEPSHVVLERRPEGILIKKLVV